MTMSYRLPAEWEPQSAVMLTFPHEQSDWAPYLDAVIPCFADIITSISHFQQVLVVCDRVARVKPLLPAARQDRLLLVEIPSNDTWARDHGGITVLGEEGPLIWDFVFNGWGLKFPAFLDNRITTGLQAKGIFGDCPVLPGGMVLEGGAIESDGLGTIMTTKACLLSPNRNPHLDQQGTEVLLKDRFGCDRVIWLEHGHLIGDDTDSHIDTLARFCDPYTIAYVRCDNREDEHFAAFQFMEMELKRLRTSEGKPYCLVPLPWPAACYSEDGHRLPATYANFLITNDVVLVPFYDLPQDALALETLKNCFRDRAVVGINCRALIEQHGSLHCVTMQFPEQLVLHG